MAKHHSKLSVLLLNPPYREPVIRDNYCCFSSKSGYIWPPVDLLYLSGSLHGKDTQIHVIDAVAEKLNWKETIQKITVIEPQVIITLSGTLTFQTDLPPLGNLLKKRKSALYLLGNMPCFEPIFFLKKYPYVDGIIHNFFDGNVKKFILGDKSACQSISYRSSEKGEFKKGRIDSFSVMEEIKLSHPPLFHLFPLQRYSTPFMRKRPMVTVLTSFGCPFRCSFCVASSLPYHPRNINDLRIEFDEIKKKNIREIFFEDSTFNHAKMKEVCQLMIDRQYGFSWSANIHSYNAGEDILRLMKNAGCHTVQIGVESGNRETLIKYAPSKNKEKIRAAVKACKKVGLEVLGYFIIGFPNETAKSTLETIRFARTLGVDHASFSTLTPDYGTQMREEVVAKGYANAAPQSFDASSSSVIQNSSFPPKEQEDMVRKAYFYFYADFRKILRMLFDYRRFLTYAKNAAYLIGKYFVNKK